MDHYLGKMTNKSKRKGTGYERECVDLFKQNGFKNVQRAWGSDGRSLSPPRPPDVDLVADDILVQCKRRKSVPKWLRLGNCEVVMFRADRDENYVIMKFDDYMERTKYDRVDTETARRGT